MRAVRFEAYGDVDVLTVQEVPDPSPGEDEVLVRVRAAGTNPGEIAIRTGAFRSDYPSSFPSGQGSDLAGVVEDVGAAVTAFSPGDEVLGWSERRNSQAELVAVPQGQLVAKPPELAWEVAGGLYVVGVTAYAAARAVAVAPGETVAVSAAAGGVGSVLVQYLRHLGATVVGIAGPDNADWLRSKGVVPVTYGDGLADRLRAAAPDGYDAFADTFGPEYLTLAVEELRIAPDRVETIIAFEAAQRLGTKAEGSMTASTPEILGEMARLVADGTIEVPVAATFPLADVRDAYTLLAQRHTRGKVVLLP